MTENEIAARVLDCAFAVHRTLGPGLLERVYVQAMQVELDLLGIPYTTEQGIPAIYQGKDLGIGYRADLIVAGKVIVEVKAVEVLPRVAPRILLTYLRLAELKLGILINFNEELLKNGIRRVVNEL